MLFNQSIINNKNNIVQKKYKNHQFFFSDINNKYTVLNT